MSPQQPSTVPDRQSEKMRRGRPPVPRDHILEAAETLLATAATPGTVTMDDVATAAGVGKGTLFRAFGNRDGLLDALFAAKLEPLRAELERPDTALGPDTAPAERAVALLRVLLAFKFDNQGLVTAREVDGAGLMTAPHYRWVHGFLAGLITAAGQARPAAELAAHVLLGTLRVEVIAELRASGMTRDDIEHEVTAIARRLLTEPA